MPTVESFRVAGFAIDGEFLGEEPWKMQQLSSKWLAICKDFLAAYGDSFDEDWAGNLKHIRTRFTASNGAALVTFSAHGRTVASIVLTSGHSSDADTSLQRMFVSSLRQVDLVGLASKRPDPFEGVFSLAERPLMVVVPWAFPETSEEDHGVVRDLAIHLAGAYFSKLPKADQPLSKS